MHFGKIIPEYFDIPLLAVPCHHNIWPGPFRRADPGLVPLDPFPAQTPSRPLVFLRLPGDDPVGHIRVPQRESEGGRARSQRDKQ